MRIFLADGDGRMHEVDVDGFGEMGGVGPTARPTRQSTQDPEALHRLIMDNFMMGFTEQHEGTFTGGNPFGFTFTFHTGFPPPRGGASGSAHHTPPSRPEPQPRTRLEKLRVLAERGATQGERDAAKAAIQRMEAKGAA